MSWSVIFSSKGLWDESRGEPYKNILQTIDEIIGSGKRCFLFSNNDKPWWFTHFSKVQFVKLIGRQTEGAARAELGRLGGDPNKCLVILSTDEDFLMAVNSKLPYLSAAWTTGLGRKPQKYGVQFEKPNILPVVLNLLETRNPWYYVYDSDDFAVYSLTNAGNKNNIADMMPIADKLRAHLKDGNPALGKAFKILFMSSLLKTPALQNIDFWAYYPASSIKRKEDETISDYADQARYALSCRNRHPHPLLIRHTPTAKRNLGGGGNRIDPNPQIQTLNIHEYYDGKLEGRTIAVVDDFTTYGTSFGVAHALLKECGARKVICFAMGKFGQALLKYDINLDDAYPYDAMDEEYEYTYETLRGGTEYSLALEELCEKMKGLLK